MDNIERAVHRFDPAKIDYSDKDKYKYRFRAGDGKMLTVWIAKRDGLTKETIAAELIRNIKAVAHLDVKQTLAAVGDQVSWSVGADKEVHVTPSKPGAVVGAAFKRCVTDPAETARPKKRRKLSSGRAKPMVHRPPRVPNGVVGLLPEDEEPTHAGLLNHLGHHFEMELSSERTLVHVHVSHKKKPFVFRFDSSLERYILQGKGYRFRNVEDISKYIQEKGYYPVDERAYEKRSLDLLHGRPWLFLSKKRYMIRDQPNGDLRVYRSGENGYSVLTPDSPGFFKDKYGDYYTLELYEAHLVKREKRYPLGDVCYHFIYPDAWEDSVEKIRNIALDTMLKR